MHMPKTKGMTSLEVAIIVAIILVIAIAVGWYLYTTFAAASQQSGITVTEATIYATGPTLVLRLVPQGAAQVAVARIEVAGTSFTCSNGAVSGPGVYYTTLSGLSVNVGQVLSGRVVLQSGNVAPFTATVVAGEYTGAEGDTDLRCSQG